MTKKQLGLWGGIAAMLLIAFGMPAVTGLPQAAKMAMAVSVFAIIVWVTQAIEDALSGLIIVLLLAALKATSLAGAFSGYSNTSLWLIVIGFIMAGAMEKSGLSKRIALYLVNLAGGNANKIYWAIALVMLVMTFLVPSITARTLLMLPIVLGIGQAFNAKEGQSNIVKALLFIVAMSGTAMSIGVLTAHVGNPITVGLIQAATGTNISWAEWFRVGAPPAFTLAFISVLLIRFLWPPEMATLGQGQEYVKTELDKMGPVTRVEYYTLLVFSLTLALWATDSIHRINVAIVGLFSVVLLLWPGIGVMSWKEAQTKVPWSIFVLYGAGLSMGGALATSGAAKWLAGTMLKPIAAMDYSVQIVLLIWIVTALQVFFTGGGPKTTALTPIVIAHATAIGANPMIFALVLGMNMQHQYLLPVSNMPNAVINGTNQVKASELMKTGAYVSVLAATFFSVVVFTYWKWIGVL
ncbi:MAG: Sodium:sulfate symporter transrane [Firmicutes bacterium]|nr:Sodium:sulfate symporter transrane [Bacillota bacterium]